MRVIDMYKKGLLGHGGAAIPRYLAGGIPLANVVAAYEFAGAASYAASLLNLAKPATHTLSDAGGIAPAWTQSLGLQGASGKYLITDFAPSANMSIIAKFSGCAASDYLYLAGSNDGSGSELFGPYYCRARSNGAVIPGMNAGVLAMIVPTYKVYENGINVATFSNGNISTCPFYLMTSNVNGTPGGYIDGQLQAIYFYSVDITSYLPALQIALQAMPPVDSVPIGSGMFTYSSTIGV